MFDNILIKTPEQIEGIRGGLPRCGFGSRLTLNRLFKAGVTIEYL